jgi:uncharacterized phage-associated protein
VVLPLAVHHWLDSGEEAIMFREDKATQMAARFLQRANGKIEYIKLIKLLYLADKTMLQRHGEPIVYDKWYSIAEGPILSAIYDLIKASPEPRGGFWANHIRTVGQDVLLQADPGDDGLSRAENNIIDEVFARFGGIDRWSLVELTYTFPEWCDPGSSRIPIHYKDVLKQNGLTLDEIQDILDNIDSYDVLPRALLGITG